MNIKAFFLLAVAALLLCSCSKSDTADNDLLFDNSCQPQAILHNGKYYFIKQDELSARITLWCADDIRDIAQGVKKTVWVPKDSAALKNIWSPEIHHIDNCWYIYYEADDGNSDNINIISSYT